MIYRKIIVSMSSFPAADSPRLTMTEIARFPPGLSSLGGKDLVVPSDGDRRTGVAGFNLPCGVKIDYHRA